MIYRFREHYGNKFQLKINKLPVLSFDRLSVCMLFFSFIFGLLFFFSGIYLLTYGPVLGASDLNPTLTSLSIKPYRLISTQSFGIILSLLGFGIVLASAFFDLRFKKIYFDGSTISVKDFPLIGRSHSFDEKISNYEGVRLRLKFCQYGIINKNKFIIELYHKDLHKIVPLYISTNSKNVRHLWKEYALFFNLPPIHISDKGMVSHSIKDMDKSYPEIIKSWHLPKNFLLGKTHSQSFVCKQKQDRKMVKMKHFVYDFYSNLNLSTIIILSSLLTYGIYNHHILEIYMPFNLILFCYVFILTIIVYAFITLVMRDTILIHNNKIVVFRKILNFSYQDGLIPFSKIKSIDIFYTPTTDRYSLSIITDNSIIKVFNKLSPDDLRWIRGFLVSEINQ